MPVDYPDNDFTRMIANVASGNRSGIRGGVASATPLPTVQSADMGRILPEDPSAPLTPQQIAELDELARLAGVKDERIGTAHSDGASEDLYGSFEDAIAAGASVNQPSAPSEVAAQAGTMGRQTAREFLAMRNDRVNAARPVFVPRLPDFRKVEGIDLVNNRVIVDGMDFPISEVESAQFKQFAIETAKEAILDRLNEAVSLLSALPETAEGTDGGSETQEEVPEVQRDDSGGSTEPSL